MTLILNNNLRRLVSIRSPIRLLLIIFLSICTVETLIMLLLAKLDLPAWESALIDALLIFILMFTLLFLFMFRPLINQIEERKHTLKSLKESEERYRSIFRNIQDVYYEISMDGVFIEVSPSIKYLTNGQYHRKDILGKSIDIFCTDELEHHRFKFELMKSGYVTDYEFPLRNGDGSIIQCAMTARLYCNYYNEPVKITGSIHNILRRKEIEAELLTKNEQLKTLNAEKDKFFSIIAHDLRSPFNAFLGITSLMADKSNKYTLEELRRLANMVNISANNLYQLLENLLQWSQIKRNTITLHKKILSLFTLAEGCIEPLKLMADAKNITVLNHISPDTSVYADELMIKSVLRNLITNSLKFTQRSGKITLEARNNDNFVEVSITDTGIGIDTESLTRIFQIDEKTNRPGTEGEPSTGLGLILSKEFIEKNDGRLWVTSQVGSGSTFYFSLQAPAQ